MIIGLTGGVGSGKSLILNYLKDKYNAYIIETDKVGHKVMGKNGSAYGKIIDRFGKDILSCDGEIDRSKLSLIVFKDESARYDINNIVHPLVKIEVENMISNYTKDNPEGIVVIESALLIEGGYKETVDEIWYIYVDLDKRIERLKTDRGYDADKTKAILDKQLSDDEFRKVSDFVIENNSTKEAVYKIIDDKIKSLNL